MPPCQNVTVRTIVPNCGQNSDFWNKLWIFSEALLVLFGLLVILFVTMPKIYFHRSLTLSNFSDHFGTILFWAMARIPDFIGITCLLLSPFMDSTQGPGAIRLFSQWEMQSTFSTAPLYIPWHAPRGKWLKKHNKMVHKAKTEFPQQTSRACYHEAGAINSVTYWHYIKCRKYSRCQT